MQASIVTSAYSALTSNYRSDGNTDMGFRVMKLIAVTVMRIHKVDADGLLGNSYRYTMEGEGQQNEETALGKFQEKIYGEK